MNSLLSLPVEMIHAILEKTTSRTLCRIRRTCKTMDNLVEHDRNRLRCPMEKESSLVICYCLTDGLPRNMAGHKEKQFYFGVLGKNDLARAGCPMNHAVEITDPYRQLSAVRFKNVHFMFYITDFTNVFDVSDDEDEVMVIEDNRCQNYKSFDWHEGIELLKKMRISCKTLHINGTLCPFQEPLEGLLPLIGFQKLNVKRGAALECLQNPHIQHVVEAKFHEISSVPSDIPAVLRQINIRKVILQSLPANIPAVNFVNAIVDFFGAEACKGAVEHLSLRGLRDLRAPADPSPTLLYRGRVYTKHERNTGLTYHCDFYRVDGPEMHAILRVKQLGENLFNCDIWFLEDHCEERLLSTVLSLVLPTTPFDASSMFEEVRNSSKHIRTILNRFVSRYHRQYESDYHS